MDIQVSFLTKRFRNRLLAVDNLSFYVEEGHICGFVGPNGAGKTTTLKILATIIYPTKGTVRIGDYDVVSDKDKLRQFIGYMPENPGYYENMTISEYLYFFTRIYNIPRGERGVIIKDLLELVDLTFKKDSKIENLSRGMKQRLCIAKTLIHDPPVLLLDEPASGVDPRARIEIKALLKELKTMGKTVLISSHILPDIQDLCDEILVIEKGKKIFHGKIDDLLRTTSGGCIVLEVEVPEDKINKAIDLIKTFDGVASLKKDSSTILIKFFGDKFKYSKILKILCENNIPVFKFGERETGLEDAFIKITKGELA